MELPGLFESMAEASVTLAGFAAVSRAFATGVDPDGYSTVRLNVVIEGGLAIALLCYLPAALDAAGLAPSIAWRTSNALAVAWVLPRSVWPGVAIIRRGWPLPSLFAFAWPFTIAALVALGSGIAGFVVPESAHQVGLVCQLGGTGCTFIAQFRVERTSE